MLSQYRKKWTHFFEFFTKKHIFLNASIPANAKPFFLPWRRSPAVWAGGFPVHRHNNGQEEVVAVLRMLREKVGVYCSLHYVGVAP